MATKKSGYSDGEPLADVVGTKSYPSRPYAEAISDSHRQELRDIGIVITDDTVTEETAAK